MGIIMHNNIAYNTGSSPVLMYDIGDFFGNSSGYPAINSLSISLSGHVGQTAVLIVLHREPITISDNWTFIDKKNTPEVNPGDTIQYISIYKKTVSNSSESYTIQTANNNTLCACTFYFEQNIDIQYDEYLLYTSAPHKCTIDKKDYYRLIITDNLYARESETITVSPLVAINLNGYIYRMVAFINCCSSDLDFEISAGKNVDYDRIFCYKILT